MIRSLCGNRLRRRLLFGQERLAPIFPSRAVFSVPGGGRVVPDYELSVFFYLKRASYDGYDLVPAGDQGYLVSVPPLTYPIQVFDSPRRVQAWHPDGNLEVGRVENGRSIPVALIEYDLPINSFGSDFESLGLTTRTVAVPSCQGLVFCGNKTGNVFGSFLFLLARRVILDRFSPSSPRPPSLPARSLWVDAYPDFLDTPMYPLGVNSEETAIISVELWQWDGAFFSLLDSGRYLQHHDRSPSLSVRIAMSEAGGGESRVDVLLSDLGRNVGSALAFSGGFSDSLSAVVAAGQDATIVGTSFDRLRNPDTLAPFRAFCGTLAPSSGSAGLPSYMPPPTLIDQSSLCPVALRAGALAHPVAASETDFPSLIHRSNWGDSQYPGTILTENTPAPDSGNTNRVISSPKFDIVPGINPEKFSERRPIGFEDVRAVALSSHAHRIDGSGMESHAASTFAMQSPKTFSFNGRAINSVRVRARPFLTQDFYTPFLTPYPKERPYRCYLAGELTKEDYFNLWFDRVGATAWRNTRAYGRLLVGLTGTPEVLPTPTFFVGEHTFSKMDGGLAGAYQAADRLSFFEKWSSLNQDPAEIADFCTITGPASGDGGGLPGRRVCTYSVDFQPCGVQQRELDIQWQQYPTPDNFFKVRTELSMQSQCSIGVSLQTAGERVFLNEIAAMSLQQRAEYEYWNLSNPRGHYGSSFQYIDGHSPSPCLTFSLWQGGKSKHEVELFTSDPPTGNPIGFQSIFLYDYGSSLALGYYATYETIRHVFTSEQTAAMLAGQWATVIDPQDGSPVRLNMNDGSGVEWEFDVSL